MSTGYVTRFAPSPTGLLHLGHALAALTAARAAAPGDFIVRMEDLDQARSRPEFERAILEDLAWLGLSWRATVLHQSQRSQVYEAALEALRARQLIYPCFCTRSQIAAEIAQAAAAPHAPATALYPGTCRDLSPLERSQRLAQDVAPAWRLDCARACAALGIERVEFEEMGRGPGGEHGRLLADPTTLGDIVLARKQLPAAYHLAVVIDDAWQGVTLVTRGNDLFEATAVQRLLQMLLGLPAPRYGHHRLLLDAAGHKFSKRDQAMTLASMRARGLSAAEVRALLD